MLLFIEGYPYKLNSIVRDGLTIRDILKDVESIPMKEDTHAFEYVGYCYSKTAKDVIFFLPKVVLTGEINEESEKDTIFGASPQEIIDFESEEIKSKFKEEEGCKEYKEFLSTLSIWIYRTISVYKQKYNDNILESREYQTESRGRKQKYNTLLDVIIALRDFNRNNQDYFTFIVKNVHSGHNKINWNKTISKSDTIIQQGTPIYLNPVNRKKMVNFDEELLVIYFSILNYIREIHGFSFDININYQLINSDRLKNVYINKNLGCRRLKQIKYKFFSDKALRIWDLCYAFFDREYKISMNRQEDDYLLAKNFEHIFEVMIDTLVGGNDKQNLDKELTDQKDGKLVDHMFVGHGLIEQSNLQSELTYYIGDSKYYKRSKNDCTKLDPKSIYKQYTYARNVIQWNMNLFLDGNNNGEQPQLRDALTEGYNPIPNFFISARIPNKQSGGDKFLSFEDKELKSQEDGIQLNRQFENRLFDRDTLLLCHYDVNFLYIVSLYGRDNKNAQAVWREYVRNEFRSKIQSTLNRLYEFRILQPRDGMNCYGFIQDNFRLLNGKIYRPKSNGNYLILALMKNEEPELWKSLRIKNEKVKDEVAQNDKILDSLKTHFHVSDSFTLERDFHVEAIENVGSLDKMPSKVDAPRNGVLMVMMENYDVKCVKFLEKGILAVGIKPTKDSMRIVENRTNIGYILFHTRKDEGQHLFAVEDVSEIKYKTELGDAYPNITTADMYVVVTLKVDELNCDNVHSSKKEFDGKSERYDSQYATMEELMD